MGMLMDRKISVSVLLLHWYVFLATTFFTSSLPIPNVICRNREREALLAFKQHIKDDLNQLSSWTGKECCVWQGINCDNMTRHVVQLNLTDMLLQGFLNDSLKELNHLHSLDLSGNFFEDDHVPKFLGSFQNLEYLSIDGSFTRANNLEWLSNLSLLKSLKMSEVNLSRVPNLFQKLNMFPFLSELVLSDCQLHINYDPTFCVNFSSLTVLDLSSNHISHPIVHWLSNLTSLVTLDLSHTFIPVSNPITFHTSTLINLYLCANNFSIIPNWLCNMTNLEKLDLSENYIQHLLPNDINYLSCLIDLDLSSNQLYSSNTPFHVAFHNISTLKNVNLQSNGFSTIPYWLQNATNLQRLDLSYNLFAHILPSDFCSFSHLMSLDLSNNNILGEFVFLGNSLGCIAKNLEFLHLENNSLFGSIPMFIGTLSSLKVLDISYNHLNGTILESFGNLSNFEELYIDGNVLEGSISELHISNLTRLKIFSASSNRLSLNVRPDWIPPFQLQLLELSSWQMGPQFPTWLQSQKDLQYLGLSKANISDVIPFWFWNGYSQLNEVHLSHNQIHGPPPSHFSSTFQVIDFSYNSLHGSFPPTFCQQKDKMELTHLDLSRNLLFGELPDCWMNYSRLKYLELGDNNLMGNIPSSLCSTNFLKALSLYKNNLSGNLPLSLQNCKLKFLDLSENNFSGDLPIWLGNSSQDIGILMLHSNKFKGSIPRELCHLKSLQILDLAHNNFSGDIPQCFGNLSSMAFFPTFYYYLREKAYLVTKGEVNEYGGYLLGLVKSMDLSSNSLTGEIPQELTNLSFLQYLNLSNNQLHGKIPKNINAMKRLETLDVSMNQLTDVIPQSMASLTFLDYVNFSYNYFSGKIPTGTQFQSFSGLSFIGNRDLCGPPLTTRCPGDEKSYKAIPTANDEGGKDNGWLEKRWFYMGMPYGFVVGFWGVFGPLVFNKSWRYAYYKFWDDVKHRIFGA